MDVVGTPRSLFVLLSLLVACSASAQAQPIRQATRGQAVVRSENFIVSAADPALANEIAQTAEKQRYELAVHWLDQPLPNWSQACPITVVAAPRLGAGGSTTYSMSHGSVGGWRMNVQGSRERILDSVLPHEITHTILASHFAVLGKPVPRWADEGACTTVEHESERSKHDHFLVEFLSQGRGLPFATMFTLKDYPSDIMPLYAQGYSVTSFLVAQGGPRRFVQFLEDGLKTEDWVAATEKHYGYPKIGKLQTAWNRWVSDGGGQVDRHTAIALGVSRNAMASNTREPSDPVVLASTDPSLQARNAWADAANKVEPVSYYRQQFEKNANGANANELLTQTRQAAVAPLTDAPSLSISPATPHDYSVGHPQPVERLGGYAPPLWLDSPNSNATIYR